MLNDFLSKVAREHPTPIRLEEIEFKGRLIEGEDHARIYEADCHVKLAVSENKPVLVEIATQTGMLKLEVANNEITIGKFDVIETRGRRLNGFRAGTVDIAAEAMSGQKKEAMVYDPADWGGCPECHTTDGYLNVLGDLGMEHWFFCENHKLRWYAGTDLFSSWRDMPSNALQKASRASKSIEVRGAVVSANGWGAGNRDVSDLRGRAPTTLITPENGILCEETLAPQANCLAMDKTYAMGSI